MSIFNNEELQQEFDQIEEELEEHHPQLVQINKDISKLEKMLNEKGFCVPISVFSNRDRKYFGEDADFTDENEYVEWNEFNGEWRLLLKIEEAQGCLAVSNHPYGEHDRESFPLLDAKPVAKFRANKVLAQFVREIGAKLRDNREEIPLLLNEDKAVSDSLKWLTMK